MADDVAPLKREGAHFVFGYSRGTNFTEVIAREAAAGYDVYQMGCSPAGRFWAVFKPVVPVLLNIEVITEAFHTARCSRPDSCPAKCPHRMPVDLAVAVHKAITVDVS